MSLSFKSKHESRNDGVYRGPREDMPRAYIEEECGLLRLVIPNRNVESWFEQAADNIHKGVDAFTCDDRTNPLEKNYPKTLTPYKSMNILKGIVHIAEDKSHDPVLSPLWAQKTLNYLFGIDEDLRDCDWFFNLCDREKQAKQLYN
jgi:hypothetical protein